MLWNHNGLFRWLGTDKDATMCRKTIEETPFHGVFSKAIFCKCECVSPLSHAVEMHFWVIFVANVLQTCRKTGHLCVASTDKFFVKSYPSDTLYSRET